jgi:hypothetical protein
MKRSQKNPKSLLEQVTLQTQAHERKFSRLHSTTTEDGFKLIRIAPMFYPTMMQVCEVPSTHVLKSGTALIMELFSFCSLEIDRVT